MRSSIVKKILSIGILSAILISYTLQWSKCKSGECKSCSNKGCVKCLNLWVDHNYDCKAISGNTINFCLHEYEVPATTSSGGTVTPATKYCRVCNHGYRLGPTNTTCVAVGSSDCYAGEYSTINGVAKFRCTNCINGKMAGADGECTLAVSSGFSNCIGTNMTYAGTGVVQSCSHCDYGYSLDQDNNCKLSCAEGCLKCDANHVCIECDHYRNWWSTSPHNCTNPTFDYYNPNYNASILKFFTYFVALTLISITF